MWIRELGVQEQPKAGVLLNLIITQQNDTAVASPDESPSDNWQNNGVNGLAHVLDDHRKPLFHRLLKPTKQVVLAKAQDLKVLGCLLQL